MDAHASHRTLRAAVPQLVTATRLALGSAALVLALEGDALVLAATLITLGAVADSLDGWLARRLDAASSFGALFDHFTDYLAFVVAPWVLARALLVGRRTLLQEVLLDLPLVTGVVRYARNSQLVTTQAVPQVPGLSAVFLAFVSVTCVFLRLPDLLSTAQLTAILAPVVAVLSILMIVPVRYPRLIDAPRLSLPVLALVAAMPFVQTEMLAGAAIPLALLYILVAPFFVRDRSSEPVRTGNDGRQPRRE